MKANQTLSFGCGGASSEILVEVPSLSTLITTRTNRLANYVMHPAALATTAPTLPAP